MTLKSTLIKSFFFSMTLSIPPPAKQPLWPLGGAKCSIFNTSSRGLSAALTPHRSMFYVVALWLIVTRLQVHQMMISAFPGDYVDRL